MTEADQLKALTRSEKRFLSRHVCGWCDMSLSRSGCGAIYTPCDEPTRIQRRKNCLETYKPRYRVKVQPHGNQEKGLEKEDQQKENG